MGNYNLNNIAVLVTRPKQQADKLVGLLEGAGGKAILFPTIEISPPETLFEIEQTIQGISQYNIIIFISANAVRYGLEFIKRFSINPLVPIPSHLKIAAIGESTAFKLSEYGYVTDWLPTNSFTSEALLALEPMQQVENQHILIVRGLGGREFLAEQLRARGAHVGYLEVYRRNMPTPSDLMIRTITDAQPQVVTSTSFIGLKHLITMLPKNHYPKLYNLPLIVVNSAMLEYAKEHGFQKAILLANNASDQSIMECINDCFTNH